MKVWALQRHLALRVMVFSDMICGCSFLGCDDCGKGVMREFTVERGWDEGESWRYIHKRARISRHFFKGVIDTAEVLYTSQ